MMRVQVGWAALCATSVRNHLAAAHPHHNHLQHAHHSRSYQVVARLYSCITYLALFRYY
jgi:hypothetical protein